MNRTAASKTCLILLLVAVAVLSCLSISVPPMLDDVDQGDYIRNFASLGSIPGRDCYGMFRPVKNFIFFFVLHWASGSTAAGHCISAVLYVVATSLVVALATRLFKSRFWGVCAGTVWALAPTQVSAIAWLSCSNILLMTTAVMAALVLYLAANDLLDKDRKVAAWMCMCCSGVFYLLGLLSYESAVMFPALLVLWDKTSRREWRLRRVVAGYGFLGVLTLGYVGLRLRLGGVWDIASNGFSPMSGLQVFAASAWFMVDHFMLWLWPLGKQEILGTFVWESSASSVQLAASWAAFVFAISAVCVFFAARQANTRGHEPGKPDNIRIAVFGLCWFMISLVPTSNLIPIRSGPFADYYLVLPSFGLAVALVGMVKHVLEHGRESGRLARPVVLAVSMICAGCLVCRAALVSTAFKWMAVWTSPKDLLRASMSARDYPYRARANLARLLVEEGDLKEARALAAESAAEAPWYPLSFNVLGNVDVREARYRDACAMFMHARELDPSAPYPCFALGFIKEEYLGEKQEAAVYYRLLLSMGWSRYAESAALSLSRILALAGELDEAIAVLEAAIERAPFSPDLRHNLRIARKEKANADFARNPMMESVSVRPR